LKNTRRHFLSLGAGLAGAAAFSGAALGQAPARLLESDPAAQSFGYKDDASKVDKAKFSNYVAGSMCGSCALFQGTAGAATGPCPIFQGKLVSSKGWCSAYTKKA
jgi:hypothetical protein